jgi:hypothetical protein
MSFNVGTAVNNLAKTKLSNPATADLDLQNTFKVKNSVEPVLNSDLATKNYVDIVAGGPGASTGTLPFSLVAGPTVVGQFTNPTGNDLQLSAPTTTGKLIFSDIHGIDFTNSPATFTNNTGNVITVSPSGTTKGIRINGNNDPNAPLFEIVSSGGERHFTSSRSGVVNQSQVYIRDTTTGGLTMVELSKENNGPGLSMTKTAGTSGDAILITNNGTGYALSTAGTKGDVLIAGTLEQNGRIVQNTGGSQDTFSLTHSSGTGDGLHITKNGTTGHAINIDNNGTGNAINATISTATGGILITKNANSGAGIPLQINHINNFTAGSQSSIDVNHNSNAVGVNIANAGSTGTMLLTQTGAGYGLNVNKVSGSGNCVVVSNSGSGLLASLSSSGTGISYTHNNTGANAGLTFTKSNGTGGRMVDLTYSNSGSDDILRIDRSSGGGSGNMVNLINTTNGVVINATNSGTASNMVLTNSATSGSSANASFVKTGAGNGDNVQIRNTDAVGASTGIALSILNQGVGDCLRIQDEAGDTSLFRCDSDGNIGIGVSTSALTHKFVSNGGSGTTTTQIAQSNTGISTSVSDSTVGTSQIFLSSTNTEISGRSDITLEPSRGTATALTTPRIRMTVASGSNNGILFQGNNATAGTNFRFGFTSGSTGETSMNVYGDTSTRRVRIGQQDIYTGIPSGVLELTRNATPHGTSIPHILLNGTNATGGVVMNCNAGRIENVADPVNATDVANRQWVLANAGGTATAFTLASGTSGNANSQPIINLSTPTAVIDNTTNKALAVNKEFVEKIQQAAVGRWFSSWNQSYTYSTTPIYWTTPDTGAPIAVDVDGASTPNTGWYAEVIGTNFTSQYCYLDLVPNAFGGTRSIYCWRPRFIDSIFKITVNMNMPDGVINWNVNTLYWNASPNNVARYGMPKMWVPVNNSGNRSISFTRYFKFLTSNDYITIVDDSTTVPRTITTGVEGSPQSTNGWEVIIEYIGRS